MDLAAARRALDDLYWQFPHLPRNPLLAETVLNAWNAARDSQPATARGPMKAVVKATWQIGSAAGAARGHDVVSGELRDAVGALLARPAPPDPDGRWVVYAAVRAAEHLPQHPDLTQVA